MKIFALLSASLLATASFTVQATEAPAPAKAPVLMTDAQMKTVVAGSHVGPGFGICTAVGKAHAPGAIARFGAYPSMNLPGNGGTTGNGTMPGFGLMTAGKDFASCMGER